MNCVKKRKISIISLLVAFVLFVAAAVISFAVKPFSAFAADRYVELDGGSVFYTGIRGAEITDRAEGEGESQKRFTMFRIGENQTVAYRQNLAYSWISSVKDDDGKPLGEPAPDLFSMKFAFTGADFKRFIIRFQSQQNVYTENDISENYLIFTPVAEGKEVEVKVAQSLDEDAASELVSTHFAMNTPIEFGFTGFEDGEYFLKFNGTAAEQVSFKNVYEPYAAYVASGDNAVTPLTFSAEFEENAENPCAEFVLYEMNGQSFEVFEQGKDSNDNPVYKVKDNASPVMCFNRTPSYLEYGKNIGLDFKVIDVLVSNPRYTAYYYVLNEDQYAAEGYDYDRTDYSSSTAKAEGETEEGGEEKPEEQKDPFVKVTSGSSIRIIRDEKTFIPSFAKPATGDDAGLAVDENVYGLVKLYYEIADGSGDSAKKDKVFVNWYAKPEALVNIYELKKQPSEESYFLKLIDDKPGVTYAQGETATKDDYIADVAAFEKAYQHAIDEAIAAIKDEDGEVVGKLYAGSDNKFYLPSFENLKDGQDNPIEFDFAALDDYCGARDYKYSIYYKAKTTGSNTNLAYNKLAMNLTEADVTYRFTIFVTDQFGNPMRYPDGVDATSGEIIWKEITTNDIWDDDFEQLLPRFEFDVSYKEATSENPENLPLAYVGTSYSGVKFDINGVSGTYSTEYKLYVFDRNAMYNELGENLNYEEFGENYRALFANTYKSGVNTRKYFTTVKASDSLLETDENYEEFKAIAWNAANATFVPQSVDDFYIVELRLTDNRSEISTSNFATVAASMKTTSLKGESDWLENNKTSVILLSVAAACLIALIALLIIKPKDKGDIDAIYLEEERKKEEKANAKRGKK